MSAATNSPAGDPDVDNQDDIQYATIQHQRDPRRVERSPLQTEDEVQYACVQHRRDPRKEKRSPAQTSDSEAPEEVQYATVQHSHGKSKVKKTQEDEEQYGNVRFNSTGAAYRLEKPV